MWHFSASETGNETSHISTQVWKLGKPFFYLFFFLNSNTLICSRGRLQCFWTKNFQHIISCSNIALGLFGIKLNVGIVIFPMKEMSISVQLDLSNNTTLLVVEISFLPPSEFVVHSEIYDFIILNLPCKATNNSGHEIIHPLLKCSWNTRSPLIVNSRGGRHTVWRITVTPIHEEKVALTDRRQSEHLPKLFPKCTLQQLKQKSWAPTKSLYDFGAHGSWERGLDSRMELKIFTFHRSELPWEAHVVHSVGSSQFPVHKSSDSLWLRGNTDFSWDTRTQGNYL